MIQELDHESEEYKRISETLREVAKGLQTIFPGVGFALMVFPFGEAEGRVNYISNAARDEMVPTIEKWLEHIKASMPPSSTTVN